MTRRSTVRKYAIISLTLAAMVSGLSACAVGDVSYPMQAPNPLVPIILRAALLSNVHW